MFRGRHVCRSFNFLGSWKRVQLKGHQIAAVRGRRYYVRVLPYLKNEKKRGVDLTVAISALFRQKQKQTKNLPSFLGQLPANRGSAIR